MSSRIISATIQCAGQRTHYPTSGDLQYTKPVSVQYLPDTNEIVIFEDGERVDVFLPTFLFVPDPGKTGMWYRGKYKGHPATLCITSLTDGGDKVNGQSVSVLEPLKIKTIRR